MEGIWGVRVYHQQQVFTDCSPLNSLQQFEESLFFEGGYARLVYYLP